MSRVITKSQSALKRPGHYEHRISKSVEWYTPPMMFDALGVHFDLDVCSPGKGVVPWVPAGRCFTMKEDGLRQPWSGRVWMNPPFGSGTVEPWIERFIAHGNGIALFRASTDVQWFHQLMDGIDAVLLVKGRIPFISGKTGLPEKNPTFGIILAACGIKNVRALENSGLGKLLVTNGNGAGRQSSQN